MLLITSHLSLQLTENAGYIYYQTDKHIYTHTLPSQNHMFKIWWKEVEQNFGPQNRAQQHKLRCLAARCLSSHVDHQDLGN